MQRTEPAGKLLVSREPFAALRTARPRVRSRLSMMDRIRRSWSALLRLARLRPPRGHMNVLRGEMSDREEERVARDARTADKQRAARDGTKSPR
jgi:hypothetical protein